jgi:hypothetical protein
VDLPLRARPVCLPVLARLWRPRYTGKLAHARVMVELVAARHPDRIVHAVGDAAYVGDHLRGLNGQITWTSRLKVTSVLYELAPPRTGKSGRPRTKGPRLGHPGRPGRHRDLAHHQGPPLRTHRHRRRHRDRVPVVRVVSWSGRIRVVVATVTAFMMSQRR